MVVHPVVVPPRKEVKSLERHRCHRQVPTPGPAGRHALGPGAHVVDVDPDVAMKPDRGRFGQQDADLAAAQAPHGRAEVAGRAVLVQPGPQRFGQTASLDAATMEGDVGDQSLAALGETDLPPP